MNRKNRSLRSTRLSRRLEILVRSATDGQNDGRRCGEMRTLGGGWSD